MKYLFYLFFCAALISCGDDDTTPEPEQMDPTDDITDDVEDTPAYVNFLNIDLDNLDSYTPIIPEHFGNAGTVTNTPVDNPITDAGATLGRVLFYEKALSFNNTVSCASCHSQANGFDDPNRFSTGFEGGLTGAHAMRLLNGQYYLGENFFWDRRAESLEAQTTQPIQNDVEMGFDASHGGLAAAITKLSELEYYPELFEFVYGDPTITEERMQRAMAQFIRAMVSSNSKFDDGFAAVYNAALPGSNIGAPFPNFDAQENDGKILFINPPNQGGVGCAACHQPPTFALNLDSRSNGLDAGEITIFKSPSLKSAATSTHFMHDGRFETLAEVIEHYNSGIENGPVLDNRLRDPNDGNLPLRMNLTDAEKLALEAFIETLTDNEIANDARFTDPFIN